jgi:Short C-terminal domain
MFRRRRPLLGAAMIGGAAYAGHRAGENRAYAEQQESDQEARLAALEAQQYQAAPPPPPPPPAAAAPANDMVSQIQQLAQLRDQGILSPEEFASAKAKVLAG